MMLCTLTETKKWKIMEEMIWWGRSCHKMEGDELVVVGTELLAWCTGVGLRCGRGGAAVGRVQKDKKHKSKSKKGIFTLVNGQR